MWLLAALIIVIALAILGFIDTRKPKSYPPGPKWLPLLGSFLHFRELMLKYKFFNPVLDEYHRLYGPVVGLRLGTKELILVFGKDAVQEGLAMEEFDGRQCGFFIKHRSKGERKGVIFTDGEEWKEQRRFALRNLRDLGFGKRTMESTIREDALELVSRLTEMGKRAGAEGVDMQKVFNVPVLNSLWSLMTGQRYSQEDETLKKFTDLLMTINRLMVSSAILDSYPWLRFLYPWFKEYDALRKELRNFFWETVEDHKKTKTDGEPRDFIDTYLDEMKRREGDESYFSEEQLLAICDDLFAAGTETTSYTLAFGILYLLHHSDVQTKMQEELDRVIGRDRFPTLADKQDLPYLNAVLLEIQRCCDVVGMTVPHRCLKDTNFRGYTIPKDSAIAFSLRSVHRDPVYWGDPDVFRPERFLATDEKGGMKLKDESSWLILFGHGQRRCLGEPLARVSLYVFFSIISHGLRFSNPPGCDLPSTKGVLGFVVGTGPFKAVVEPRF